MPNTRFVFVLVLCWQLASARIALGDACRKVVFVRDNQIFSADADGSNMVELTASDDADKSHPKWSPDGRNILYSSGTGIKFQWKLVVITQSGRPVSEALVSTREPDGTVIPGMRFVEEIGWFSASDIYASGSVTPRRGVYTIRDARTGSRKHGYLGANFLTCSAEGQVAYTEYPGDPSIPARLAVNGSVIYETSANHDILPLGWYDDCRGLAAHEGEGPTGRLILFSSGKVEGRIPLPAGFDPTDIDSVAEGILMVSPDRSILYSAREKALVQKGSILDGLLKEREKRAEVLQKLNGQSADWWCPVMGGAR